MSSLEKALFGLLSSEKETGPTAYESAPTNEGRDDNKFLFMAAKEVHFDGNRDYLPPISDHAQPLFTSDEPSAPNSKNLDAGIASGSGPGVKMSQLPPVLGLVVLKMFGQMRALGKIAQKPKHDSAFSEKVPLHGDWLFVEKEEPIVVGSVKKVETGHSN
ncbi:hypothetical protein RhiJN_11658 [Ceratobasidium sp. AG-Ba]|nr:hypothetical protein RhiJN_11658 [Ceratobasidium sp. AG-Ba]